MWVLPLLLAVGLSPQTTAERQERPVIVTSGYGELRLSPERALIRIGVESQDSSAAEAGAATSLKVGSVIDTLVALGFRRDSLPTVEYRIRRDRYYIVGNDESRTPRYIAETALEVSETNLDRIGTIIDAALAAGANDIPFIRFQAGENEDVRSEALAAAVRNARDDAEALARAAGGTLGSLLELSTQPADYFPAVELAGEIEGFAPPVTPRGIVRRVAVTAKWRFIEPDE